MKTLLFLLLLSSTAQAQQTKVGINELAPIVSSSTFIVGTPTWSNTTYAGNTCVVGSTLTITTNGGRVMVGFAGPVLNNTNAQATHFAVKTDGAYWGTNTESITFVQFPSGNYVVNNSFTVITPVLTAGSHSFCLDARVSGGTGTIYVSNVKAQFWVTELR